VEHLDAGARIRATVRYGWFGTALFGLLGVFAVVMLGVLLVLVLRGDPLRGGTLPACLMPASMYVVGVGLLKWGISRSVKIFRATIRL
jgi:hypothetical protein